MKKIRPYLITFVGFYLVSCTTVSKHEIHNLKEGEISKIGHAGLGFPSIVFPFNPYPSNGFTALEKAMEYGADGLEVDVQMTRDSVLVLFHDLTLESITSKEGCVRNFTWGEIQGTEYELGFFYDLFHNDQIISLDSLLKWTASLEPEPELHFDVRTYITCFDENPNKDYDVLGRKLIEALDAYDVSEDKVRVISTDKTFIEFMRSNHSAYPLSYEITDEFEKGLDWAKSKKVTSLTVSPKLLTKERVDSVHQGGIELITFGAKSYSGNVKLVQLNPDAIQSNNVRALGEILVE